MTISQGGVLPHIAEVLLYKRSQWGKLKSAAAAQSSPAVTIPASPKPAKVQPAKVQKASTTHKKSSAKKPPPKKAAASKRKSVPKKKKPVEVCFIPCFHVVCESVVLSNNIFISFMATCKLLMKMFINVLSCDGH